ncbi:MAG: hypothetical protein H0X64_14490 [Gemmatimonadaceae bacterium]|nr:hypothetical protein [Gemmatimonadaceae bacterium]
MSGLPIPRVPWQVTGNHWISLPCVHPADGAVHALGVLHRGARSAIEIAGGETFVDGTAPALLRPIVMIGGLRRELAAGTMAWERALGWLPTFTCPIGDVLLRGTVFAPYGRDADMAGVVYALAVENRGAEALEITLGLEGTLGHRQLRVRTPRAFDDAHRIDHGVDDVVVLQGSAQPGLVSLAIGADGPADITIGNEPRPTYSIRRTLRVEVGGRAQLAFYVAASPERDGAEATVAVLRRRGWRDLLAMTRDALQALEQSTGNAGIDHLVNRNLLFAYFYAVGRALDDAHYYLVRTRVPWHSHGVTVRDWDALAWTIPAIQLADPPLARELLIRACELHGYAPGQGVHYFDGTLFQPGFSLEGAASYALGVERYIRETGDDQIIEEPVVADTLYLSSDDLAARKDKERPLYATEVTPAGVVPAHPYTLHGNAVAAFALDVFRRTLDEEAAREVQDPQAVRAAIRRHFGSDAKKPLASAIDLAGQSSGDDDPSGSAGWLPLYDAIDRNDTAFRRTIRELPVGDHLAQRCSRLLGPEPAAVLQWLRRAPLDGGLAAEVIDEEGRGIANGGDASLSGLVAWSAWYAIHALGVKP